ncbi:hypothetical protein D0C36_02230 [Mucilaginibacter conchicola]|uniref:Uncharacterized protein n=1 Tax=Mucilaginibacter conchicola TaxID=2303333 RepID=A0A372NWJ1_9SPHI|nr:hypothetical protein D0C36_02230 [Mucilaginibacter conchicola]
MKIFSVCLAVLFFLLMCFSVYNIIAVPNELVSPLIPESIVESVRHSLIISVAVNFSYFIAFLFVAVKRKKFAKGRILFPMIGLYVVTEIMIKYILT